MLPTPTLHAELAGPWGLSNANTTFPKELAHTAIYEYSKLNKPSWYCGKWVRDSLVLQKGKGGMNDHRTLAGARGESNNMPFGSQTFYISALILKPN